MQKIEHPAKNSAKRISVVVLMLCLLLGIASAAGYVLRAGAAMPEPTTYYINSSDDFETYSREYRDGNRNPQDVLEISINEGEVVTTDGFISLGTSEHPFAGTLKIPSSGVDVFHLYNCPLFDYVSTDMTVSGAGVIKIMRESVGDDPASGVLTAGSLFANHVVAGSGAASWSVSLLPYSGERSAADTFDSVIGEIASGCDVTLTFTNTETMNVSGAGNVGLLCGTLQSGAILRATTAGSGSTVSVSSTGGHAGGLIGKMENGSSLFLQSANLSRVASVTSANGYAGGLVGYADNAAATVNVAEYAVSGSVTGKSGAGGLFGYYKSSEASATFSMERFTLSGTPTVSATAGSSSLGGVFGQLVNEGSSFTFNGNAKTITVNLSGGTRMGGIIGGYSTTSLTNTLTVTNTKTSVSASSASESGGILGSITGMTPAYLSISDVTCTSRSSTLGGGVLGSLGTYGSFADLSGFVNVSGSAHAGILYHADEGVLRLRGVTDISTYNRTDGDSGQLVKNRGRVLVWAMGDGSGINGNWTLKRNLSNSIDDISSWGEVLRTDGVILSADDLFTVDDAAHTVTLKSAVPAMGSVTDLALTALNIQLNTDADPVGSLQFTAGNANKGSTLLSGTLSITADLSFAGTGLTGLTRDSGAYGTFTGTFNGNNHTITLAIGEKYGLQGNGQPLSADSKQGKIHGHLYNGLFALAENATVQDLTINGEIGIYQKKNDKNSTKAGALFAQITGPVTLDQVTVSTTFVYRILDGVNNSLFGGAIGCADNVSGAITVTDCTIQPIFRDETAEGIARGGVTYVGGVIGSVSGNSNAQITISGGTVGINYSKTVNTKRESAFGGIIGQIQNTGYKKGKRTVSLSSLTVDVTATGTAAGNRFGGIFGTEWCSVDVTVNSVTVANATVTANGDAVGFGGLVQIATGHWDIRSISLTESHATFSLPSGGSFGFVANKAFATSNANTALYLDVDNTGGHYNISALTFSGSPSFTVFDEILADSRFNGKDIVSSGQAIVSVTTTGNKINTTGTVNTYLNQTAYGKTVSGAANPRTRYYYNLAYARANLSTSKYDFLIWTVREYAHSSLSEWFTPNSSSFTGNLDMTGLSYYPIHLTRSITFSSATLKLDHTTMHDWVKTAYTGEGGSRNTLSNTNQHYLMHTSVFLNATAAITANGLTLQGNVPRRSEQFCGFLVSGTLGGLESGSTVFSARNVVLDGVTVTNPAGANYSDTTYAPLLINKVGKNTTLTVNGLTQQSYSLNGIFAASSPIGDVGSADARAIRLTFTGIALDGRSVENDIGNMNSTYGTTRSVFSRAMLLNSFLWFSESSGSYNFTLEEDWSGSTGIHGVTYGREISTSVEFAGQQKNYYGSAYFTHPTVPESGSEYDFSTGFLPYVYVAYNAVEYQHELSVNVTFSSHIEGCGKYGDPFIIDTGEKLAIISRIITGNDVGNTVEIDLPSDLTSFQYTSTSYTKKQYNFGAETFVSSNGGANLSNANVRRYLAGAYYSITAGLILPSDYVALGTSSEAQYAFRGVIIGNNKTIQNTSPNPFIYSSTGCVVKDLTVEVAVNVGGSNTVTFPIPASNSTYQFSDGIVSYGAVIGQIMGGDTILDGVNVTFTSISFAWTANNDFRKLTPIGGYVGSLVNGGLIFRNMTAEQKGLTTETTPFVADNSGYLYVNPIIGRVLAGYAFHETNAYHPTEATATVKNSTAGSPKNYAIPDLNPALAKLAVSTTYAVTVPNGQALYVLGAIVNSGAANAGGAAVSNGYSSLTNFWQGYAAHTAVRAGATYSGVGTTSGDDFTLASKDLYTADTQKIPYVIRAYTTAEGGNYYARAIAKKTPVVTLSGNCDAPEGFRGIGNIYKDADDLRLPLKSMDGNGYTVTLRMKYLEYEPSKENYKSDTTNKTANNRGAFYTAFNAGFGLFNRLVQKNAEANDYIGNFTISGTVFYDLIGLSSGTSLSETWSNVSAQNVLNVGGLAGIVINNSKDLQLRTKEVHLNNLTVEGPKYAGGLVGLIYISDSNANDRLISACDADHLTVIGGKTAAGLIGYLGINDNTNGNNSRILIAGADGKSEMSDLTITVKGPIDRAPSDTSNYPQERLSPSAAGLIGYADVGYKSGRYTLCISNVRVKDSALTLPGIHDVGRNATYLQTAYAGGLIGGIRGHHTEIHDVEILRVAMDGDMVGGLIAYSLQPRFIDRFDIYNILIDGKISESTNAEMTATDYVGGLIGWYLCKDKNKNTTKANHIIIRNYDMTSAGTNGAVGGLIGYADISNTALTSFAFHDIEISDCVLTGGYTAAGNNDTRGVGGLFGAVRENRTNANYLGYNILLEITLDGAGTTNFGAIVGNNMNNGAVIKIAGIATNVTTTKTLGTGENKNGGYAVYANYGLAEGNTAHAGIDDAGTNTDNCTNVAPAVPYVTVNPPFSLGGKTLTGDGFADRIANLPIQSILTDGLSGKYGYAASSSMTAFQTYLQKFAMFTDEVTGYEGTDFPVLVLEDTTRANSHSMINHYLRLLTNTTFDFGVERSGVYDVVIYNMVWENGVFTPSATGASLKRSGGEFYMTSTLFDSGKMQFSLIDLRFYDPADPGKVAYHLYVPVFVKRVLLYQFDIAVQNGTTYHKNTYTSRYGTALIENVGMPITFYFNYSYSRTVAEWVQAINGGENLNRNYAKILRFVKANENELLKAFPANTVLVLVDPNRGGKPFYATIGTALAGEELRLSTFRSVMSQSGEEIIFSGENFAPVGLFDLIGSKITVSADPSGTLVACAVGEATFIWNGQGYRLATDSAEDLAAAKYSALVKAGEDPNDSTFTESYYLSVFTKSAEDYSLFHYYLVTSPTAFSETNFPAKRIPNAGNPVVHLVMGKIFHHSDVTVTSDSLLGSELMNPDNDSLVVTMSAQLGLSEDLDEEIRPDMQNLIRATQVYHSFLVYLNRRDGEQFLKAVIGNPVTTGSRYGIDGVLNGSCDVAPQNYGDTHVTQNYAEFVTSNLNENFATGSIFEINATLYLTWQEEAIPAQFPGKGPSMPDNGVTVSGASNIAFSAEMTSFSKNRISCDEIAGKSYYSETMPEVALLNLNPIGDRVGDFTPLGINALNLPFNTRSADFDLLAVLDITSVVSQVPDYADAVVTVSLEKKQNDGSYGGKLDLSQYLTFGMEGVEPEDIADLDTSFSVVIPKTNPNLSDNGVEITLPTMHFSVRTGTDFENDGFQYGNYRISVTVQLRDAEGTVYRASTATNEVIYTNAKVATQYVDAN